MGGGLGHPFFVWEILRVEGLAPWPTALGIDRGRRVHAADLYPQLGRHCVDQPRFTAGQQEMRAWLGLHVDPGMEMQEMGVDRWGHGAGVGVDAQLAVMSGAPDRCAAPLAASATEIGLQAGAATLPAISVREAGVGGDETIPARFEPIKLATGCENVVSEDGDVAQRPCEQRGDDLFREPRRAVLPDMPVARDAGGRLSGEEEHTPARP